MNEVERRLSDAAAGIEGPAQGARRRVAKAAEEQGVLDVAYATVDSPFGPLTLAGTRRGLVRLAYPDASAETVLADLARRVSPRVLEAPERLDEARRELEEYFEGRRTEFDLPVDLSLVRGFGRRVLGTTSRIPYGDVRTYGEVAARSGSPRASRAAGNALGANPIPVIVPCHRVVHAGGGLGGYTGGLDRKEFLLRLEGFLSDV